MTAGAAALVWRGGTWRERVLGVLFLVLVVRSWRNAPLALLVLAPYVAARLEAFVPPRPAGRPWQPLAVLCALMAPGTLLVGVDPDWYPPEVPGAVRDGERVYQDHLYGGWLLFHGIEVFWDGRNDCYPAEVFEQGVQVAAQEPGWRDVLDRWQVDVVVTRREELVDALDWPVRLHRGDAWVLERVVETDPRSTSGPQRGQ